MRLLFAYLKEVFKFLNLPKERRDLIFFSEGAQYFSTFEPILKILSEKGQQCCILTMSQNDPILKLKLSGMSSFFIGGHTLAPLWMNLLSSKVVVMTTPNLHTFNIKRSPGTQHYTYLFHAPTGCGLYRSHAFDHFDSILCAGQHQERDIRVLEHKHQTHQKTLYQTGFPHLDFLFQKKQTYSGEICKQHQKTVLIAGTWGKNSCLELYGEQLIHPLIAKDYQVIVRPHPQTPFSNPSLLKSLKQKFEDSDLVIWDQNSDGMESMLHADIMISDLSGIIFDFAFLCKKPILCIESQLETEGTEIDLLHDELWELKIRKSLGKVITEDDLPQLAQIVEQTTSQISEEQITALMHQSLYHVGQVGEVAATQIIEILESL